MRTLDGSEHGRMDAEIADCIGDPNPRRSGIVAPGGIRKHIGRRAANRLATIAVVWSLCWASTAVGEVFNQMAFTDSPYMFKFDIAETQEHLGGVRLFGTPYESATYAIVRAFPLEDGKYWHHYDAIYSFVSDPAWDRIVFAKRDDHVVRCFGGDGECDGGAGLLDQPTSIDIAPIHSTTDVYLFVADTGNNRVVMLGFDSTTESLSFYKVLADTSDPLNRPMGVSWDDAGTPMSSMDDFVWVADTGNHRIVKFEISGGTVVASYTTFEDMDNNEVTLRYPQGIASFRQFGSYGSPIGPAGNRLFVADTGNNRILRFIEREGILDIDDEAGRGYALSPETAPDIVEPGAHFISVDVDQHGTAYVPDQGNSHLYKLKFDPSLAAHPEFEYPILPLKVYGEEGATDEAAKFMHPKSSGVMRGRVSIEGEGLQGISWQSLDEIFTLEDWTDQTGGQRHNMGVECEIFDINVDPGTSTAELYYITRAFGDLTVEIWDAASGSPVRTIFWKEPAYADLKLLLWDGKDGIGEACPQGEYVLKVTSEDWEYEDGGGCDIAVAEETFTFPDPIPEVTVNSPNGGEVWALGSEQAIDWDIPGFGPAGRIEILVSTNGGADFQLVGEREYGDRDFQWDNVFVDQPSADCVMRIVAYYEDETSYRFDDSDSHFTICNTMSPFAAASTVWEEPEAINWYCPAGDGGTATIGVQVKNCVGDALVGISASAISAEASSDSGGSAIAARGASFAATSDTDSQGIAFIEIPHVGGCGDLTFGVYAQGILIGQQTVHIKSPDLNGDCVVDVGDYILFTEYFLHNNPCADFDGGGLGQSDIDIFYSHYGAGKYHFSIHPGYSSATVTPSDPSCMVLCPKGDMDVFSTDVEARNARNEVFVHSAIPADSIWAQIPGADGIGFRLVCRDDPEKAVADGPTSDPENTTITVNSAGGSCWAYYEQPPGDWAMTVYIGGHQVGEWTGFPKSPDIDASGVVNGTDFSLWSEDYFWCSLYTPPECRLRYSRSDFNCDDTVDEADFDILNPHYKHRCGASSQMAAEGQSEPASWTAKDAAGIRSHLPNHILDRLLVKELHAELRTLLSYVRSMDEPDSLAVLAGEVRSAAMSLVPQVTSMSQNAPNPFMGTAMIGYQVAAPGGQVTITIFDVAGRRVRVLVDEETPPGFYKAPWDGRDDNGRKVPSGVYFYQMKAPGFTSHKRMMLVR